MWYYFFQEKEEITMVLSLYDLIKDCVLFSFLSFVWDNGLIGIRCF